MVLLIVIVTGQRHNNRVLRGSSLSKRQRLRMGYPGKVIIVTKLRDNNIWSQSFLIILASHCGPFSRSKNFYSANVRQLQLKIVDLIVRDTNAIRIAERPTPSMSMNPQSIRGGFLGRCFNIQTLHFSKFDASIFVFGGQSVSIIELLVSMSLPKTKAGPKNV